MSVRPRVLITGGSGLVGGLVIDHLSDKYAFSNLSRRPVESLRSTEASNGDLDAIRPAFEDIDDWDGQLTSP